jgi:hypothetical protein
MAGDSIETAPISREQAVARDRAAFLAGDEAEEAVEEKPLAASHSADESDDEDEAEKPAVATDEDPPEDEEDDEDEESEEDDSDEDLDAPGAKAMAQVRKAEKRMRERMAGERQAFERERQQWQDEIKDIAAAAKRFERMQQRAKYEPDVVLAELGLTDDDFELASRRIYARTKTAAADPKNREAVERMTRERESADRLAALEKKNQDLETRLEQQHAAEKAEREGKAYLKSIVKAAVPETAPLLKRQLEKNPSKAENALAAIAVELFDKHGTQPLPEKVIKIYEKRRRAELEELGVDVAAIAKPKTAPKTGDKKTAGKPAETTQQTSKRPTRNEIIAEIEAGQFE